MAKKKYIEGQVYEFKFKKKVFIDEEHLVFENEDSERFVIPSMHYRHYNLQPEQMIKCLIIRVDCSGKISFEPEHPYYELGGIYDFDFVRMQVTVENEFDPFSGNSKKVKHYDIIVADKDGYEHHVVPKEWQKKKNYKADKIKCRIAKMVKGHFQLLNLEENTSVLKKLWR
jgi:hypothetical protein